MSTPKHRILFLTREFTLGGASFYAVRLMEQLLPQYEIDLLVIGHHDKKMLENLPTGVTVKVEKLGILDRLYALIGFKNLCFSPLYKRLVASTFLQNHYKAVLAISMFPDPYTEAIYLRVSSTKKIAFLVDERIAKYSKLRSNFKARIQDCLNVTDHIITVSDSLYRSLCEKCKPLRDKSFSVLRPFVANQFMPDIAFDGIKASSDNDKLIVLTVARLTRDKKILNNLHIHQQLKSEGLDFTWYIVGEGEQYKEISKEIKRLDMQSDFILTGFQQDLRNWIAKADVFALFSVSEGCPTAVIEAMYMQCPVISTDVHGIRALIKNEVNGLIVDDDIEQIKRQLKRLLNNVNLRDKFRQHLHDWSVPAQDDVGVKILKDVINSSNK